MLYEIHGNIYGLANAPWTFTKDLLGKYHAVAAVSHSLDIVYMTIYDDQNDIIAIFLYHVDDGLH
eukprot:624665-Lingulodinium_polyedra.AAC.1